MCGFSGTEDCAPLNGCGSPVAYFFFCSFTLIVSYVMLNLTVADVLERFATSQEEEEESVLVPELLEEFQYKWAMDPTATGFIRVVKLLPLVHAVLPPLGWFGIPPASCAMASEKATTTEKENSRVQPQDKEAEQEIKKAQAAPERNARVHRNERRAHPVPSEGFECVEKFIRDDTAGQ